MAIFHNERKNNPFVSFTQVYEAKNTFFSFINLIY